MAAPQIENGHLKIADALVVAICREDFSAVQLRVLLAVMNMTYRVGKTKAEISYDDLRYATGEKRYKVTTAVHLLIDRKVLFSQQLVNDHQLLGIQKDYEQWLPKMGNAITSSNSNITSNTKPPFRALPKMGKHGNGSTPPGRLLTLLLKELNIELTLGQWRKEYSKAVELYTDALELAHSPLDAIRSIKDYFDFIDNPAMRAKVRMPMSYLAPGYRNWFAQLPKKPRSIREDEAAIGYRYRYNLNNKKWEVTSERIKPHN